MAIAPHRTLYAQNSLIETFFVRELGLPPAYSEFYFDQTLVPASPDDPVIYKGTPLVKNADGEVLPMTGTYAAPDWTLNGVFAGFAMENAYSGQATVRMIFAGALITDNLDLSKVSQTAGEDYTFEALTALPNVDAKVLSNGVAGYNKILNLLAVGE